MKVTNKITIHLDDPREIRPVNVMQCDAHTRELEIALFSSGKKWEIPSGITPVISYRKPDGTGGLYDTLPDGTPACRIDKNMVWAILPAPALDVPGRVDLVVIFTDGAGNQLATFSAPVEVHRNPGVGAIASGDYFNLQKWVKETAVAAVPNVLPNPQKLILTGAVEAEYDGSEPVEVKIPESGIKEVHIGPEPPTNGEAIWINPDEEPETGADPEAIKQAVDAYMAEHPETDPTVPDWAKQPEKPKYTAAEVGASPVDGGIPIPSSAQVGQTIVVKAVDENGKPTEWEAADLPSGGEAWETIADIITTEEVDAVDITTDTDGNAFELSDAVISVTIVGTENNATEAPLAIAINAKGNAGGRNTAASRMFRSAGTFSTAYYFHARAGMITGHVYNVGNSADATAGFCKSWDSTPMRAFYFDNGVFGVGSHIVIEGVRK